MKNTIVIPLVLAIAAAGVFGGRWWEARQLAGTGTTAQASAAARSASAPVERIPG